MTSDWLEPLTVVRGSFDCARLLLRRFSMLDMNHRLRAAGRLAVGFVFGKVQLVRFEQLGVAFDDEHVLGIFHFGLMGKVEAAGDQDAPVNDHDFVVCDGVH